MEPPIEGNDIAVKVHLTMVTTTSSDIRGMGNKVFTEIRWKTSIHEFIDQKKPFEVNSLPNRKPVECFEVGGHTLLRNCNSTNFFENCPKLGS